MSGISRRGPASATALTLGEAVPVVVARLPAPSTLKTAAEIKAEEDAWRDAQPTVGLCVYCPDFRAEGTAEQQRAAFAAHKAAVHPDRVRKRRHRAIPLFKPRPSGSLREEEDRRDAMVEVARRKRTTHA